MSLLNKLVHLADRIPEGIERARDQVIGALLPCCGHSYHKQCLLIWSTPPTGILDADRKIHS